MSNLLGMLAGGEDFKSFRKRRKGLRGALENLGRGRRRTDQDFSLVRRNGSNFSFFHHFERMEVITEYFFFRT